ncbi:MAG TPA: arginine deiminase-related protein [Candidatus Sulfotelmatobacter sp.]|nr:arginine deiminase-related protein [Candidatus Sulfotelmatobacter sp.]
MSQIAKKVIMVEPSHFGFNPQTADSDPFQHDLSGQGETEKEIREQALNEFNGVVSTLKHNGIEVEILPSPKDITPDEIFPNNWFTTHEDGTLVIYPMLAENRRAERQVDVLKAALSKLDFDVTNTLDLTNEENSGQFLEGTGSLVLDRINKFAFVIASPRSSKQTLDLWCQKMGYQAMYFHAVDKVGKPIYHTNVSMNLGKDFAVICTESVTDQNERNDLLNKLKELNKTVVDISLDQVSCFCGNILQLQPSNDQPVIIMSETAFSAYNEEQKQMLSKFGKLVHIPVPTIQEVGGGGVRCMLAEVF